jgi:hypothetical protein
VDRAFGSEPDDARPTELRSSVATAQPLTGPGNLRLVIRPWVYLCHITRPANCGRLKTTRL